MAKFLSLLVRMGGGGWIALAFVRKFIPGRKDGAHGILGCIKIQDSLTGTRNSRRQ